jgi:hypothetical protein
MRDLTAPAFAEFRNVLPAYTRRCFKRGLPVARRRRHLKRYPPLRNFGDLIDRALELPARTSVQVADALAILTQEVNHRLGARERCHD